MAPWDKHGPLRVSKDGHYLQHTDGTGFFWLGDTAWCIASLSPEEVDLYLADRAAKGFTVIQVNVTNFGKGDYLGRQPFEGKGPPWPSVRPNEAYWSYIDEIVTRIAGRGMYAVLFALWGRNAGHGEEAFFGDPKEHNYRYGLALGQRYGARQHVVWCASGEYDSIGTDDEAFRPTGLMYLRRLADGIRDGGGGEQLITFHPWSPRSSSAHWHEYDGLSFNMIQTFGHERGSLDLVSHDYGLLPAKPVLNGEPGYEGRHLYLPHRGVMDAWHLRLEAYGSLFSGGFGFTYGHVTVWHFDTKPDRGTGWRSCLDAPGASQMQHVKSLMMSKPILARVPDSELVTEIRAGSDAVPSYVVGTRDRDRTWAFIYTAVGHPFSVNLGRLEGNQLWARWYDPRTGRYSDIGTCSTKGSDVFEPPGKPGRGNDWVLVLQTA